MEQNLKQFSEGDDVVRESRPSWDIAHLPFQEQAKFVVRIWIQDHLDKTDKVKLKADDVYVVWFSKTLQNWKALVSTTLPDGMYYEVTYNGYRDEIYLDAYKKFDNVCIPLNSQEIPDALRS